MTVVLVKPSPIFIRRGIQNISIFPISVDVHATTSFL